jgi:hypothetical protein
MRTPRAGAELGALIRGADPRGRANGSRNPTLALEAATLVNATLQCFALLRELQRRAGSFARLAGSTRNRILHPTRVASPAERALY